MSNLQESFEEKFSTINNTVDTTSEYDPQDIEENKFMAILAYFGILVIIPILAAKDSKFARFHSNQGLILCITAILYSLAYQIFAGDLSGTTLSNITWGDGINEESFLFVGLVAYDNSRDGHGSESQERDCYHR